MSIWELTTPCNSIFVALEKDSGEDQLQACQWPSTSIVPYPRQTYTKINRGSNHLRSLAHDHAQCRLITKQLEEIAVCLFGFSMSSSTPRLYRGPIPGLKSNNFTCCHTRDRAKRRWLLSQPVRNCRGIPNWWTGCKKQFISKSTICTVKSITTNSHTLSVIRSKWFWWITWLGQKQLTFFSCLSFA